MMIRIDTRKEFIALALLALAWIALAAYGAYCLLTGELT